MCPLVEIAQLRAREPFADFVPITVIERDTVLGTIARLRQQLGMARNSMLASDDRDFFKDEIAEITATLRDTDKYLTPAQP